MKSTQNKRAFFVIGPESSGTRMMAKAFVMLGAYGDGGHKQKLDREGFAKGHEMIVFRRSVPHGKNLPPIANLIKRMQANGYEVFPVVILRDKDKCAASQVKNHHAKTIQAAKTSIQNAVSHIWKQLSQAGTQPHVMYYEPFVRNRKVRERFFNHFNLPHPDMEFFDGNKKY